MQEILTWEGWTVINTISQLLLSIAAFFTIWITMRQIGNGYKAKLSCDLLLEHSKRLNKCGVEVTNLGMSYLYIKNVYITFCIKGQKLHFTVFMEKCLIQPGETIKGFIKNNVYLDILSSGKISEKILITIETSAGKKIKIKIKTNINELMGI